MKLFVASFLFTRSLKGGGDNNCQSSASLMIKDKDCQLVGLIPVNAIVFRNSRQPSRTYPEGLEYPEGDWLHDENGLDDVSSCGNPYRAGNFEGSPALVGGQAKTTAGKLA